MKTTFVGIDIKTIDFHDRSMWIKQEVQRVSDKSLTVLPKNEYKNNGLLICKPDGRPIDLKDLSKWFKKWQTAEGIKNQIEFQGLRKSGQMHKVLSARHRY